MTICPEKIEQKAEEIWKFMLEDDCTAILAKGRKGKTINLFTGPPKDKGLDKDLVEKFLNLDGLKNSLWCNNWKKLFQVLQANHLKWKKILQVI